MSSGRLLFVHDHRFARGDGGTVFTTTGAFPASLWRRYLDVFDSIDVVAREAATAPDERRLARSDRRDVAFHLYPSVSGPVALARNGLSVRRAIAEHVRRSDAVVARLPSEFGLVAAEAARAAGKPYAIEVVGCAWDAFMNFGGPLAAAYAPVAFVRMRRALSAAPFALYVTRSWLQGRYPCHGATASASNVEITPPDEVVKRSRAGRLASLAAGATPVLGTIASLATRYKGIQTAIDALASLRARGLALEYRVLGAGDRAPWQALAANRGVADLVHFDGAAPAGEPVRRWLDGVDVYLQPSLTEGLPRATIEAMSRGCACIASSVGGLPELLPAARLHRPGDAAGLARVVSAMAVDPAATARASRDGFREALTLYHPDALHERRVSFYRGVRDASHRTGRRTRGWKQENVGGLSSLRR